MGGFRPAFLFATLGRFLLLNCLSAYRFRFFRWWFLTHHNADFVRSIIVIQPDYIFRLGDVIEFDSGNSPTHSAGIFDFDSVNRFISTIDQFKLAPTARNAWI